VSHSFQLAPSILSADFARLGAEIDEISPAVDWVHVDVMDGHYVPNLTIGPPVVKQLRRATDLYLDTHLMITDPSVYAPQFVEAGSDSVTFHPEVDDDPLALIDRLHEMGAQVGVAIKPAQPLQMVEELLDAVDLLLVMTVEPGFGGQSFMHDVVPKIAEADAWRRANNADFRLEVDGGITADTIGETVRAGADTFVAGSAVFNHDDRVAAVRAIMDAADAAAREHVGG
jgi:ribulose-phosphate 3-epimerase